MAGFDVPWTEILIFLNILHLFFCSFLDNVEVIVNKICFWREKELVTERPRSLNPGKAIAMAIYPIITHFITQRALSCMTWRVNLRAQ